MLLGNFNLLSNPVFGRFAKNKTMNSFRIFSSALLIGVVAFVAMIRIDPSGNHSIVPSAVVGCFFFIFSLAITREAFREKRTISYWINTMNDDEDILEASECLRNNINRGSVNPNEEYDSMKEALEAMEWLGHYTAMGVIYTKYQKRDQA